MLNKPDSALKKVWCVRECVRRAKIIYVFICIFIVVLDCLCQSYPNKQTAACRAGILHLRTRLITSPRQVHSHARPARSSDMCQYGSRNPVHPQIAVYFFLLLAREVDI